MSCAQALINHGFQISLFDKGRRPGGRLSTRTHRLGQQEVEQFDHGAQYFSARGDDFQKEVKAWCEAKNAAEWPGRFVRGTLKDELQDEDLSRPRYVGLPSMDQVAYALAEGLDLTLETQISTLKYLNKGFEIFDDSGASQGHFDKVVLNMPSEQALSLLGGLSVSWKSLAQKTVMEPCWALMTTWEKRLPLEFDGARLEGGPLSWVGRNSSKPGREDQERWVIHGSPKWTRDNLELSKDEACERLLREFRRWAGIDERPLRARAHRWRYAQASTKAGPDCLYDSAIGLGACGDWCHHGTVEGAWRSGFEMAKTLLKSE